MPVLLAEQLVSLEFADLLTRTPILRPARPPVRAAGAHQSDILAYIARKVGWLGPEERDEEEYDVYPFNWFLGCCWEEGCASLYPSMEWQPGERVRNGIAINPDGISAEITIAAGVNVGPTIEEFKFSSKSVITGSEFLTDKRFKLWQHQGREYCFQYDIDVVRWHVAHYRGNYKDMRWPIYKQYIVQFSQSEKEQTHALLCRYRDEAMAAREGVLTS